MEGVTSLRDPYRPSVPFPAKTRRQVYRLYTPIGAMKGPIDHSVIPVFSLYTTAIQTSIHCYRSGSSKGKKRGIGGGGPSLRFGGGQSRHAFARDSALLHHSLTSPHVAIAPWGEAPTASLRSLPGDAPLEHHRVPPP